MNFSKELLEKAKTAKTPEELAELAKTEGIDLTTEQAETAFAELHSSGELADEELDNVAGGCNEKTSPDGRQSSENKVVFLYKVGQEVEVIGWGTSTATILETKVIYTMGGYYPYYRVKYKSSGSEGLVQQGHIELQ